MAREGRRGEVITPADNVPAAGRVVLDHVGLFVPEMDRAAAAFERLGFRLTPLTPQRHRLAPGEPLVPAGTANRLAIMGLGYVEMLTPIADTPLAAQLRAAIDRYAGLHLIALGSADADASHAHLAGAGFAPQPPIHLERTVETTDGEGLARFSVVRVPPGTMAEGRVQYCRHHTPELVWQERWLEQPNAASALSEVLLCVDDPAESAGRFGRFVGRGARRSGGDWIVELDRGRLAFTDRQGLARTFPDLAVPAAPFMAALAVTSGDLARTRRALDRGGLPDVGQGGGVIATAFPDPLAGMIVFGPERGLPPWLR